LITFLIFFLTYAVVAIGRAPGLRVDRTGAAIIGAILMIVTGAIGFDEAVKAVDFRTLALLFGMMVLVAHLRLAGGFAALVRVVCTQFTNPAALLVALVVTTGLLSALFVNDTICIVFTPIVLDIAETRRHRPIPYLLALATASNIGSVATMTGNPQNMLIGEMSGLSFRAFAAALTPVATTSSTTSSTTSPAPSASATVPVQSPSAATGAGTQVALPAYFVGASSGTGDRFGLYREFVRTAVPAGATPAQRAKAAIEVAMNAQPFTNDKLYIQPWSGTSVQDVSVDKLITITLSGSGSSSFTKEQTRLAVQELVWTAQAAIGKGTIPVKFVVADGSATLFGTYPTAQTYNRPAKALQYQDLAPIWITSPAREHVFTSGASVVATGESCAFEATTQWQLKKSGAAIRSGVTTASSVCPLRGTWQVKLGALAPGDYTFRMFEVSAQDGQGLVADASTPFTVK